MDFSSMNSVSNMQYQSAISNAKANSVTNSLKNAQTEASDVEMMNACKEFEAYMVEQMFKQAMDTIKSVNENEDSSGYSDYAYDLQAQQYGKIVSDQGSFGLAQQLYEAMKANQGVDHIMTDAEKAEMVAKNAAANVMETAAAKAVEEENTNEKVAGVSEAATTSLKF